MLLTHSARQPLNYLQHQWNASPLARPSWGCCMTPPKRSSRHRVRAAPVQAARSTSCPQGRSFPTCQMGCHFAKDGRRSCVTGGTARRTSTCIFPSRIGRRPTSMDPTAATNPSGTSDATSLQNFSIGECPSSLLNRHTDSHILTLQLWR